MSYANKKGKHSTIDKELAQVEEEMRLRGFTPYTIATYLTYIRMFLESNLRGDGKIKNIGEREIKSFLSSRLDDNISHTSLALIRAALKFYIEEFKGKEGVFTRIKIPKKEKHIPEVLTKEEIRRMIEKADSDKKKIIVMLLYASGLRVSELTNLKVGDLDLSENIIRVRGGKGRKDRIVILARTLKNHLNHFITSNNLFPQDYLIKNKKGKKISSRYIQKLISTLSKECGINKRVTPHTLRHSFATHLLEAGESIRKIQELLGHSNLQTTQIYTKVSNEELKKVISPLDNL